MDRIGWIALAGLAFALALHAALLLVASVAREQRALAYPALVACVAWLLAWQGLVPAPWLPAAVGALLLAAAAAALARRPRPKLPSLPAVERLALVVLAAGALYAAFPDYRPDQWNNDLVLAKAVASGPLRGPIFEEHVYYGGNYQYLFTLPRALFADDVFNHSAADAFSWLLLAFGLAGLLARLRQDAFPGLAPVGLLVAWAIFALPDPTAIPNAKPDPLLLLAAFAVLELSLGPRHGDSKTLHGLLFGFLLVAPVGLKLTWLPFGFAVVLAWLSLVAARRAPPLPELGPFVAGAAFGLVSLVPWALNNWRFFGNPLHPAQLGPLRSTYWAANFGSYYDDVAGRATSLADYGAILERLVPMLSWHSYFMLVPVLLVALVALALRLPFGSATERGQALLRHALVAGACFVLAWPLFFGSNIYPRYVYAGVALALAALVALLERALDWRSEAGGSRWLRRLAIAALLLPAAAPDALPRQLAFVARYAVMDVGRYRLEGPPEWRMTRDQWLVSQHRSRVAPGVGFHSRATLQDMEATYFLDGAGYRLYSRELQLVEARSADGRTLCPWRTLQRLDIAYLRTRFKFELWPEAYRSVMPGLAPLDGAPHVLYLDPRLVAERAASETACAAPEPAAAASRSTRSSGSATATSARPGAGATSSARPR